MQPRVGVAGRGVAWRASALSGVEDVAGAHGCLEDTGNTCDANEKAHTRVVVVGTRARARGVDVRERARDGRARVFAHARADGVARCRA